MLRAHPRIRLGAQTHEPRHWPREQGFWQPGLRPSHECVQGTLPEIQPARGY